MSDYCIQILVTVDDEGELYKAALERALNVDKLHPDAVDGILRPDGAIDKGACLQMLLDPGTMAGCTIDESRVS